MRLSILTLTIFLLFSVSICQAEEKAAATVNGKVISEKTLDTFLQQQAKQMKRVPTPQDRQTMLAELINRELLFQEALKQKLDKEPDVAFQLEQQKRNTLIRALMQKEIGSKPVTDDELKKEYAANISKVSGNEYKARHILLKTEDEAKAVIKQLDKGGDFAKLAKEKSTGPTGQNGGDLGWFRPQQMVPPFSEAVAKMKKGTHSKSPVKTQFGWHVIKLEDKRDLQPPKFEDVKEQIKTVVQSKRVQKYVKALLDKAKIDLKNQ